eukprot:Trichotokara_eunicae@DN9806_c0_g1_i1.p1
MKGGGHQYRGGLRSAYHQRVQQNHPPPRMLHRGGYHNHGNNGGHPNDFYYIHSGNGQHQGMRGGYSSTRGSMGGGHQFNSNRGGHNNGQRRFVPQPRNDGYEFGFTVVRLKGLPYHANETHIVDFFRGLAMTAILPSTIPVDGRPSGEAYVEFANPEEAWKAMNKHGELIDRRYIELFAATKGEMECAAAGLDPRDISRQHSTLV